MLLFPTGVSGATDSSSMLLAISWRISSVIDSARDRGREPSDGARDAGRDPSDRSEGARDPGREPSSPSDTSEIGDCGSTERQAIL